MVGIIYLKIPNLSEVHYLSSEQGVKKTGKCDHCISVSTSTKLLTLTRQILCQTASSYFPNYFFEG